MGVLLRCTETLTNSIEQYRRIPGLNAMHCAAYVRMPSYSIYTVQVAIYYIYIYIYIHARRNLPYALLYILLRS